MCRVVVGNIRGKRVFVSTYESAIDAKGRVSIPASFRAALGGGPRIFLWPALDGSPFLEGGGEALVAMYRQTLLRLPPNSPAREALVEGIFASSADLKMDDPGRIKLPDDLKEAAGIKDRVVFSGLNDRFQMWDPDAHVAHKLAMRKRRTEAATMAALGEAYNDVLKTQTAPFSVINGEGG